MSKHKVISSRDKVMILGELLENRTPLNQLAEKYEIHPNDIYNWRKKLFEEADQIFEKKSRDNDKKFEIKQKQYEEKLAKKDEVISELVQDNIALKKSIFGKI